MARFVACLAVLGICAASMAQDFTEGWDDPPTDPAINTATCDNGVAEDVPIGTAITDWSKGSGTNWLRNGEFPVPKPTCSFDNDGYYGSMQGQTSPSSGTEKYYYRTLTVDTAETDFSLSGQWVAYSGINMTLTMSAELREGTDPDSGTLIAKWEYVKTLSGTLDDWNTFCTVGTKSSGVTSMTIVLRVVASESGSQQYGFSFDDINVYTVTDAKNVTITDISPDYGTIGDTVSVTITGTDLDAGGATDPVITFRKAGKPDRLATNINVVSSTEVTCDINCGTSSTFQLQGKWSVILEADVDPENGCGTAILPNAFSMVRSTFIGDFEDPYRSTTCASPTPEAVAPYYWIIEETGSFGGKYAAYPVTRDRPGTTLSSEDFAPSCPGPEGSHYGSAIPSNEAPKYAQMNSYETFEATASTTYTVSGEFAGGGKNRVMFELLDGDETGDLLDSVVIHEGGPQYDWTFATLSGTASGDLLTVRWTMQLLDNGPTHPSGGSAHASHADAIQVDTCTSPPTVSSISPDNGDNTGNVNVTITGSGFSTSATQTEVLLTKLGLPPVNATSVSVDSTTQISATLPLTDVRSGNWNVVVYQDGCIGTLTDGFLVTIPYASFANGDFESDGGTITCGTPVLSLPAKWTPELTGEGDLVLDSDSFQPATCPAPSPGGNHYGSLVSTSDSGTERYYQVLRLPSSGSYTASGLFAGGGKNDVSFYLLDGDEDASAIAGSAGNVHDESTDGESAYDFDCVEISGSATGTIMTIVVEMDVMSGGSVDAHAVHADAIDFTACASACNNPPQDTNGDNDVDVADFAKFQLCFSGPGNAYPTGPGYEACPCFDTASDNDVDVADFSAFQLCFSGPGVTSTCYTP